MVEIYGNYEVDFKEGFVRLEVSENDYEYLVSDTIFKSREDAIRACRIFVSGFNSSKYETRKKLKELMY